MRSDGGDRRRTPPLGDPDVDLPERAPAVAELAARAQALTEAAQLAATYETKGADAGVVRLILQQRASQAWDQHDARKHAPLDEAADHSPSPRSAASSNDERLRRVRDYLDRTIGPLHRLDASHLELKGPLLRDLIGLLEIIRDTAQTTGLPADLADNLHSVNVNLRHLRAVE